MIANAPSLQKPQLTFTVFGLNTSLGIFTIASISLILSLIYSSILPLTHLSTHPSIHPPIHPSLHPSIHPASQPASHLVNIHLLCIPFVRSFAEALGCTMNSLKTCTKEKSVKEILAAQVKVLSQPTLLPFGPVVDGYFLPGMMSEKIYNFVM